MDKHRTCGKIDHKMGCKCDLNPTDAKAREIVDKMQDAGLMCSTTQKASWVDIYNVLAAALREEYERGLNGTKCCFEANSPCNNKQREMGIADTDGYKRGHAEADELFVLDVDCELDSGCRKDRTCSGASHWLTYSQIYKRGYQEGWDDRRKGRVSAVAKENEK